MSLAPLHAVARCAAILAAFFLPRADLRSAEPARAPTRKQAEPDERRLAQHGIRRLAGRHLTLLTDLPPSEEIDELVAVFDQAWPQWCEYFQRPQLARRPAGVRGFLMGDKSRFEAVGLLPDDLPPFKHGYSRPKQLWWYEQPSAYYRRHLMLHEGTHCFMFQAFGSCGPPWFMEATAELLGTHSWTGGRLELRWFPTSREAVPQLGRIKLVREAVAEARALTLGDVLAYGPRAHLENEPYGWCWATAAFLDGHPRYRDRFRTLPADAAKPRFNERFLKLYAGDWAELVEEWTLFTAELDYGYDVERTAIQFIAGQPLSPQGARVTIDAARGWQSSGVRLEAGVDYSLSAAGRYQVADQPRIWWCEPGGVSIRYHNGRPLGILLAAVRSDDAHPDRSSPFLTPIVVGLATKLTPSESGTLYLRINDSPAELADNAGQLELSISLAR